MRAHINKSIIHSIIDIIVTAATEPEQRTFASMKCSNPVSRGYHVGAL